MPWWQQYIALVGGIGIAAAVLLLLGLGAPARFTMRFRIAAATLVLITILVVLAERFVPTLAWATEHPLGHAADQMLGVLWWASVAWFLLQCLDAFLWKGVLRGIVLPRLLTDAAAGLVWLIAVLAVVSIVFRLPVTGLLATSGVVAIVLGLALQNTLADLFSGIALNISAPFRIGDWIETEGSIVGRIVEIDWRTTRIRTRDESIVLVPNSQLARQRIVNQYYPSRLYAAHVRVRLGYEIDPLRARAIMHAAALTVPRVRIEPPPLVRVWEFLDWSVLYDVRFHLDDYLVDPDVKHEVMTSIWHHLHWAGIRIATPRQEVSLHDIRPRSERPPSARERVLEDIALFQPLPAEARATLAAKLRRFKVRSGETVVRAGEPGESMFFVAEGTALVAIEAGDTRQIIARLGPGQVFGEMSLLTGEPRSATVFAGTRCILYECAKAALAPVLETHPEVLEGLGEILAERRADTERQAKDQARSREVRTRELRDRIFAFFGLRRRG